MIRSLLIIALCAATAFAQNGPDLSTTTSGKDIKGEPLIAKAPYDIFRDASPAVVRVVVQDERGIQVLESATGFIVSDGGLVVTVASAIKGAKFIRLKLEDETTVFVDRILAVDEKSDLALLQANAEDLAFLELSEIKLEIDDSVYAIGNSKTVSQTFTEGSLKDLPTKDNPLMRTTASVSSSSPGAPVIDYAGRAMGVVMQPADPEVARLEHSLPIEYVRALIKAERKQTEPLASAGRAVIKPPKRERNPDEPNIAQRPDGPQHEGPLAPLAPKQAGYDSIGYDVLKKYLFDPDIPADKEQKIPGDVAAINGKKVAVMGYMIPVDFQDGGTNEFILVNVVPGCFFCSKPMPNDWIEVQTVGGKRFPYAGDDLIIVTGKFEVGPVYDGAFLRSIYRLNADNVKPADKP